MNAEDIKKLRLDLENTQREFAEKVGVEPATISNWETGRTVPIRALSLKLEDMRRKQRRKEIRDQLNAR
jgi:DNA-binding transcriptional regulator YiaG